MLFDLFSNFLLCGLFLINQLQDFLVLKQVEGKFKNIEQKCREEGCS